MTSADFQPLDVVTYFRSARSRHRPPMIVVGEVRCRNGKFGVTVRFKRRDGGVEERLVRVTQLEKGRREGAREFV